MDEIIVYGLHSDQFSFKPIYEDKYLKSESFALQLLSECGING